MSCLSKVISLPIFHSLRSQPKCSAFGPLMPLSLCAWEVEPIGEITRQLINYSFMVVSGLLYGRFTCVLRGVSCMNNHAVKKWVAGVCTQCKPEPSNRKSIIIDLGKILGSDWKNSWWPPSRETSNIYRTINQWLSTYSKHLPSFAVLSDSSNSVVTELAGGAACPPLISMSLFCARYKNSSDCLSLIFV